MRLSSPFLNGSSFHCQISFSVLTGNSYRSKKTIASIARSKSDEVKTEEICLFDPFHDSDLGRCDDCLPFYDLFALM